MAATIADALLDTALDPVALGLSGPWGSGKTTILRLVEADLGERQADGKVLVIQTDPWRYDPATGAKESLIGEVLTALAAEVESSVTGSANAKKQAKELVGRLLKRVDWAKAIKLAAKTSLVQIPSVSDIVDLVKPPEDGTDDEVRGLEEFRGEFRELVRSEALGHLRAVAVLVDDLDRCLPETVIETLEAIRLFLAVQKMSFVIAADEDRVADAIRTRFGERGADVAAEEEEEEPAKLYLHKIVQTTFPVPALSRFDTQAFLLLLQLQQRLDEKQLGTLVGQCAEVRRAGGSLDDIKGVDGVDMSDELAFASRLTPILYEKLKGNPRRIKRFLNDLRVRQSVAARRGIDLDAAVVAKLMVLEKLLQKEFRQLLEWLGKGELRDQLSALDVAAGKTADAATTPEVDAEEAATGDGKAKRSGKPQTRGTDAAASSSGDFSDAMLRWAKLPPSLAGIDLAPYLYLAATFSGAQLVDEGLPEQLRDIAANLLSSSSVERRAVAEEDLEALTAKEAEALLSHLGRAVRDQPSTQKTGVTGILRIARQKPETASAAAQALQMLPPEELTIATPLLFAKDDDPQLFEVLEHWKSASARNEVVAAIDGALKERAGA